MPLITVKDFIQTVFIQDLGQLVLSHPYIAFMTMGNGIEFLGRCLYSSDLDEEFISRKRFEEAIENLQAFAPYRKFIGKTNGFDLYRSLRCGMTHSFAPKKPITLSSKNEMGHLLLHGNLERVNLKCEDFYSDFKKACEELFQISGDVASRLSQAFLSIPEETQQEFQDIPSSLFQVNSAGSIAASGTPLYPNS